MTEAEIVNTVLMNTDIRALELTLDQKRDAVQSLFETTLDEIVIAYDWDFSTDTADESIVADQASYTLKGNSGNCRDIINIRYGSTTSLSLLDKRSPIDYDEWITGRSVTTVSIWVPDGRSNGKPKVTIVKTPTDATKILRYRYRRNDIAFSDFPEEFSFVIISGLLKRMLPAYTPVYKKDLDLMIDRYSGGGGEDNPVKQDPLIVHLNNQRARKFGYS